MSTYWGAQISPYHGRYSYRYHLAWMEGHDYQPTQEPGDDNATTIEQIRIRIMNQHPEDIAALADQWKRAYDLLFNIWLQLLSQSNRLDEEAWKSSEAKALFLEKGPGTTLAYLDEWRKAAADNHEVLRGMVYIAQDAREDMEELWQEYEQAVKDAEELSGWTKFSAGAIGGLTGESPSTTMAKLDQKRVERIQEVHKEYNRKAQELASRVGREYFEYLSTSGYGPPFYPMDAVLNNPGVGFPPGLAPPAAPGAPGGPPGAPPLGTPPPAPGMNAPPAMLHNQQHTIVAHLQRSLPAPPTPSAQPAPSPNAPPSGVPMPVLPPGASTPVPPPSLGGAGGSGTTPAGLVRPPLSPPRPAGQSGQAGLPPGALRNGVLQRPGLASPPGAAGQPALPPPGVRSPAAPAGAPPPGLRPNPPTKQTPSQSSRPGMPQTPGLQSLFSGRPVSASPPVLSKPGPERRQPDRPTELPRRPQGEQRSGAFPPGVSHTAPPVLNAPQRSAPVPPQTRRPGRTPAKAAGPNRPQPGTEWLAADELQDAAHPVLGMAGPAPSGAAVSKLEEVPNKLRGPAAARAEASRRQTGAVAPELAARRTSQGAAKSTQTDDRTMDEQPIVTDEQAFTVETPGGGVITHHREETPYRPEPPTALGGR